MRRVHELIDTVAQSDCTVLITGESGTGKDIVARTICARGRRAACPFITVDCTRGEVLGAQVFAPGGFLDAARGGTIFFDEVAEMPLPVQARLVQALEAADGGGARVLAATHHDLRTLMDVGGFRSNLFFRLRTVDLAMPPLRARKGDLSLLVHHLLARLTPPGFVAPGVAPRAWAALEAYDFPGNVRELARAIEHAMVLAHGSEIDREHLPAEVVGFATAQLAPLAVARRQFEREYARRALATCDGDADAAAALLMIAPDVLERKLAGRASLPPPLLAAETRSFHGPAGPAKARPRARLDGDAVGFTDARESCERLVATTASPLGRTRGSLNRPIEPGGPRLSPLAPTRFRPYFVRDPMASSKPERPILEAIQAGPLVLDGAMGTQLYERGVLYSACFEELNVSRPELVAKVHEDYLRAGAQIIESNTFGANAMRLEKYGLQSRVVEINEAAVGVARRAALGRAYVMGAIGPSGYFLGEASADDLAKVRAALLAQARALVERGGRCDPAGDDEADGRDACRHRSGRRSNQSDWRADPDCRLGVARRSAAHGRRHASRRNRSLDERVGSGCRRRKLLRRPHERARGDGANGRGRPPPPGDAERRHPSSSRTRERCM